MKIPTTDAFRITATVLRFTASTFELNRRCRIHKCRRDGSCTGPLSRYDAATARFVAAKPGDVAGESAPLCCFALDTAGRNRLAGAAERSLARLCDVPGIRFPEETRAVAARDWSAFSCPAQSAAPEEKPL